MEINEMGSWYFIRLVLIRSEIDSFKSKKGCCIPLFVNERCLLENVLNVPIHLLNLPLALCLVWESPRGRSYFLDAWVLGI